MEPVSRRGFIKRGSAVAAAAGVAAAVPLSAAGANTRDATRTPIAKLPDGAALTEPVVAQLRDLGSGEVAVFAGNREITVTDPHLATLLFNATR